MPAGRCRAHQCPEDDLEGERAFCSVHWDLMPQALREWLCDAYGTRRWPDVLSECIRELRRLEAERVMPPW